MEPEKWRLLQCASIAATVLIAVALDLYVNSKDRTFIYQLRRLLNWLTAGATYTVFYMARYAIVIINTESGRSALGTTPSGYGALLTCGFWSYAVGTVLGGGVVDRIGGRQSLLVGAIGCCACCTAAGALLLLRPNYWALLLLNTCNLACATLAALSVIRINVDWYTKVERGAFSGIFGIMISTGYFVALGLGGWILAAHGPAASFLAPAAALAAAVPLVACVIADRPQDVRCVTLVTTESAASNTLKQHVNGPSEVVPYGRAVAKLVSDPVIRAAMLGLFGTGWVREGFLSWFGSYLQDEAGIEVGSAGHSAAAMAITLGGMFGSLTVGIVSDRCCDSRRAPVVLACTLSQAAMLLIFPAVVRAAAAAGGAAGAAPAAILLCGALSAPLFGALTLLMAAVSVELVEPSMSGTASGLLNGAQYIGSGISTLVGGAAVEWYGWNALFGSLTLGAGMSTAGIARVVWLQAAQRRKVLSRTRLSTDAAVELEKQPMVMDSDGVHAQARDPR